MRHSFWWRLWTTWLLVTIVIVGVVMVCAALILPPIWMILAGQTFMAALWIIGALALLITLILLGVEAGWI